jgi:hypothetical protein
MAEHNYQAGVEMTITSVVKNYLRWFELHKCKKAMRDALYSDNASTYARAANGGSRFEWGHAKAHNKHGNGEMEQPDPIPDTNL